MCRYFKRVKKDNYNVWRNYTFGSIWLGAVTPSHISYYLTIFGNIISYYEGWTTVACIHVMPKCLKKKVEVTKKNLISKD